jgi:hypothetical protein
MSSGYWCFTKTVKSVSWFPFEGNVLVKLNAGAGHGTQLDKEGSVWPQFQLEEQSVSQDVSVPRPRVMGPRVATLGFTMLGEMSVMVFFWRGKRYGTLERERGVRLTRKCKLRYMG